MRNPQRGPRPQLSMAIVKYALLDVVGMVLFALGVAFFARGPGAFFAGVPGNAAEAAVLTGGGIFLMGFAAMRILREIMQQQGRIGDE